MSRIRDAYLDQLIRHLHARRRFAALGFDAGSVCFQHRHAQRLIRIIGELSHA